MLLVALTGKRDHLTAASQQDGHMYVCMWVPGGVVVRPWAHNRKVVSSIKPGTCPSGDVV